MTEPHDIITPRAGTVYRIADGRPGDPLNELDYPLTAECLECGAVIRCERFFASPWRHVSTPPGTNVAVLLPRLRVPSAERQAELARIADEYEAQLEAERELANAIRTFGSRLRLVVR